MQVTAARHIRQTRQNMDFWTSLVIAVGLAMDAFAVSLGIGTTDAARTPRPIFRLSFHFGLFQGGMTLLGWLLGSTVAHLISAVDHWIALALLAFVGIRMIKSGFSPDEDRCGCADPSRGGTLVMLCVATSLDAMAVGLGMAMLSMNVWAASLLIGVVTLGLSLVGLLIGQSLGAHFGKKMEIVGGLILTGIGVRILLSHLLV